jgi:DNA helicase MCM8
MSCIIILLIYCEAGLALSLFGGCPKYVEKDRLSNHTPIRGDPHLLIVGDPGLGKSQMLTAISHIAPRGVYVCGSYSSSTGLTVSLLKESGEYS